MTQPCRPTAAVRFIHTSETSAQKTTCVSYGTICQHDRVFNHDPPSWNPLKHSSLGNVQKNYIYLLWEGRENGNGVLPDGGTAYIPLPEGRDFSPRFGKQMRC